MNFPSVDSAFDYIKGNLQTLYNQTWVLRDRLRAIADLKKIAQERNDQEALGKLILATEQVKALMNDQLALEQQVKPFADYFGVSYAPLSLGLIPIPVYLAAGATALAAMLYLHFQKLQNQKTALDLIAKGMLPASQAEDILNPSLFSFGGFGGNFAMLGLVGVVVLFVLKPWKG